MSRLFFISPLFLLLGLTGCATQAPLSLSQDYQAQRASPSQPTPPSNVLNHFSVNP